MAKPKSNQADVYSVATAATVSGMGGAMFGVAFFGLTGLVVGLVVGVIAGAYTFSIPSSRG